MLSQNKNVKVMLKKRLFRKHDGKVYQALGVYRISGQPDNPAPDLLFLRYPTPAGSMKNPVTRPDFLNFQVLRYS